MCERRFIGGVYDPLVSVEDATEYVVEFYAQAECFRALLYGFISNTPTQIRISSLVEEIDVELKKLLDVYLPISELMQSSSADGISIMGSLASNAWNLKSFLEKVSKLKSPPFDYFPPDLSIDWEFDEPWKTYADIKSIPDFRSSKVAVANDVARQYQNIYFGLCGKKFGDLVLKEQNRVFLQLPGFLSLRMTLRMVKELDVAKEVNSEALAAIVSGGLATTMQAAVSLPSSVITTESMRSMCRSHEKYYSWTADDWVVQLKVAKATVIGCDGWKEIMAWRAANKQTAMPAKSAKQKAESSRRKQHKKLAE